MPLRGHRRVRCSHRARFTGKQVSSGSGELSPTRLHGRVAFDSSPWRPCCGVQTSTCTLQLQVGHMSMSTAWASLVGFSRDAFLRAIRISTWLATGW